MLVYILFVIVGAISLKYFLSQPDPSPIYDVYSQPGKLYSLKWWAFRIILKIRERQSKRQKASGGDAGYGKKSRNSVEEMDKVQELPTEHKLVGSLHLLPTGQTGVSTTLNQLLRGVLFVVYAYSPSQHPS